MRRLRRSAALSVAALVVVPVLGPVLAAPPAAADLATACFEGDDEAPSASPGFPLEAMRVSEAQDYLSDADAPLPGTGVVVAVLDSGVLDTPSITRVPGQELYAARGGAEFYHGTAVAGIIAGKPDGDQRIGIAPGATILDVKVYDNDGTNAQEGDVLVNPLNVSTGLQRVLDLKLGGLPIKVANMSVSLTDDPAIKLLVDKLWKAGVVVVASSGNRAMAPEDRLAERFASYQPGENAAEFVYPAGYPKVVAAATSADGLPSGSAIDYILQSTAIDVAVPTSGAPTYAVTGATCLLRTPATSWAAAEVSGVLAMLASAYPDYTPAQLVSRLVNTATGRDDVRSPLTGAGEVQAFDALTRPMQIAADGSYDRSTAVRDVQRAELPPVETDPLGDTRNRMVWFGVVGGGVLVLALVLRPVLARRRRDA